MRDPSLTTLERIKGELRIPPEDTSQDAFLRDLIVKASLAIEERVRRNLLSRRFRKYKVFATKEIHVSNTVEMIALAIVELLEYERALKNPTSSAEEEGRFRRWVEQAKNDLKLDPELCILNSRDLAIVRAGGLVCVPQILWHLSLNEPRIRSTQGIPLLGEPEKVHCHRELKLIFTTEGASSAKKLEILVYWGGEKERSALPKKAQKHVTPYALKRIYILPLEPKVKDQALQVWWHDTIALVSLYLVQEKLVSLEDDQIVLESLLSYLGKFTGAKKVGPEMVLAEILTHYQFPEDYRALRLYLSKTIKGIAAIEEKQQRDYVIRDSTGKEHLMILAAAERLGMSRRSLYYLVQQGKVSTEEVSVGTRHYRVIPDAEVERLKREREPKKLRNNLIESRATVRRISEASARRWVERQEKQGRSTQEMAKEMAEKIGQERGIRALQSQSTNADTD